jgi:hypothetical protein
LKGVVKAVVRVAALMALAAAASVARAQDSAVVHVSFDDRGLVFAAPGYATELALRLYVQPLMILQADDHLHAFRNYAMEIRRARMSFSGTTVDPRLTFHLTLTFGRPEIDYETAGIVNVISDANVVWHWTPNVFTMFGQGQVFGDRQAINPSSEMEFPDRSLVYSTFGTDRDAGVMTGYTHTLGRGPFTVRASITSGEGRNSLLGDAGLAYGARVDWEPLGAFKDNGAFTEGDLVREPSPRLAVGGGYMYDDNAIRVGGMTGALLFASRDMGTTYADAIWKWRGASAAVEYAERDARNPLEQSGGVTRAVFSGYGFNAEASYVLHNGFMPAVRVTSIVPRTVIHGAPNGLKKTEAAVEIAEFLRGHHVKWQVELGHDEISDTVLRTSSGLIYTRLSFLVGL